jgi:uncharacterized protein
MVSKENPMVSRRNFISAAGAGITGMILSRPSLAAILPDMNPLESKRPLPENRKFTSKAVEVAISRVKSAINDPEIAWLFENCFPNTLDTTVNYKMLDGRPDTFVITGDIRAMWLRDSSAQVWPYLPLLKEDPGLQSLIAGVINRQTRLIRLDPYANAFLEGDEKSEWASDITVMKPGIHERKWEIDSLCYPIRLAYGFWKATGDISVFDKDWQLSMELVYKTFVEQQRKNNRGTYSFKRTTSWQTDTVPGDGWGNPLKPVGLICSVFRPSDDATILPFLIPSNYFAVASLRQLAEMSSKVTGKPDFAAKCSALANEVENALKAHSIVNHLNYGHILAYETDGFGNHLMMDDSNVPSLLSLPYLGCLKLNDPLYQNTRRFLLSTDHCWFFKGTAAEGIGSPHTLKDKIWPMTIIMRALTSTSAPEISYCLRMLKNTHAGTGFMHESFNKNNPADFTRSWFAWANTLFGELIIKVYHEHPEILNGTL